VEALTDDVCISSSAQLTSGQSTLSSKIVHKRNSQSLPTGLIALKSSQPVSVQLLKLVSLYPVNGGCSLFCRD
jgi:hypothetical protein